MTRCVIADDERLMREQLRARLGEVWPELEIVAEAKNGVEAVALVAEHRPELVFLDIRMPGLTGVEAARQIAQMEVGDDEWLPEIVFITAYDQYAVEAFEQGVADYVLKPAERERLAVTVGRIKKRLAQRDAGPAGDGSAEGDRAPLQQLLHSLAAKLNPSGAPPYLQWIQASVGQAIQMIPIDEVLFFISDEKYTRVQTAIDRGPDQEADQGTGRRARPAQVLADPPQHAGQRQCDRQRDARLPRPPDRGREGPPREARGQPQLPRAVQGDVAAAAAAAAARAAASARWRFKRSSGFSLAAVASCSFISAMKRLGTPATVSRPRLRRRSVLTASVVRARVMPTYIRRRSSSSRSVVISSSPLLNGNRPSLTPASTTCGHSNPLAACSVDSVTTSCSSPRSARLMITLMVCATSSTLDFSLSKVPPSCVISPPQRRAIQSTKSSTLVQRAAASFSLSSPSNKCCS